MEQRLNLEELLKPKDRKIIILTSAEGLRLLNEAIKKEYEKNINKGRKTT